MAKDKETQEVKTRDIAITTQENNIQALTPEAVNQQIQLVQEVMSKNMKEGVHFGKIPGCGDKPTLLKAGAEKLNFTFRLAPTFEISEKQYTDLVPGQIHKEIEIVTTLTHVETGKVWSQGVGSCSTLESKYRYRNAKRKCPKCDAETIFEDKDGNGFYCWKKRGGCGARFQSNDYGITGQELGQVENENVADQYNTVLKMAKKRSLVDASINATACSDIFAQDLEDLPHGGGYTPPPANTPPPPPDPVRAHEGAGNAQGQQNLFNNGNTPPPANNAQGELPAYPEQEIHKLINERNISSVHFKKWLHKQGYKEKTDLLRTRAHYHEIKKVIVYTPKLISPEASEIFPDDYDQSPEAEKAERDRKSQVFTDVFNPDGPPPIDAEYSELPDPDDISPIQDDELPFQ